MWYPEVSFNDIDAMEPINVRKAASRPRGITCSICSNRKVRSPRANAPRAQAAALARR